MQAACKLGFPVLYGDGSRPVVLQTAGITQPKAVMVMYTGRQKSVQSVERLRQVFPHVRGLSARVTTQSLACVSYLDRMTICCSYSNILANPYEVLKNGYYSFVM